MCSCCATSPYREVCRAKGGIRSGETLCHIYPARPITTVSLATNTYCMMDSHSSCAPRTMAHWWPARPGIQHEAICYQWFKQRLILSVSKPSIGQWSQIKEDTIKPLVPAREFNLKAYAAITWHNDRASLGFEPRLAENHSQAAAARTTALPTAPPSRPGTMEYVIQIFSMCVVYTL